MGDREGYIETPLPLPQSLYGRTDVRTYGRSLARSYADVITKFSRLDGLPILLTHGASLARFARLSSAKNYNFREKNSQVRKEGEIRIKIPTKEMKNLLISGKIGIF